jgi:hypothetical protein
VKKVWTWAVAPPVAETVIVALWLPGGRLSIGLTSKVLVALGARLFVQPVVGLRDHPGMLGRGSRFIGWLPVFLIVIRWVGRWE